MKQKRRWPPRKGDKGYLHKSMYQHEGQTFVNIGNSGGCNFVTAAEYDRMAREAGNR